MSTNRLHAVCVPYPVQGHINPMLKVAKLLSFNGFNITFVNTEYNQKRLERARGPDSVNHSQPGFRFETIPDGLPPSEDDVTQDITAVSISTSKNCLAPLCSLISKLNSDGPPVTCIIADGCMSFSAEAAQEFGIPIVLFWPPSACAFLACTQLHRLVERSYIPLQDISCLSNGYLDTTINWIQGLHEMKLKDFPTFIRTADPNDKMLNFLIKETANLSKASAIIVNSFDSLELDSLEALSSMYPNIYSVGPFPMLVDQIKDEKLQSIQSNLWKEDPKCIEWLDTKEDNSVIYVNFGSITVMNEDQLSEFAWGLANSRKTFLWIIRPDLVSGNTSMLPEEFVRETKERGMLASWCHQEEVLKHHAIAGFLTHSGWNSTLESICNGVPMICWPFFADQQINCKYSCDHWGIGMEIDNNVKRDEVEMLVRELMDGEKGRKMKQRAMEWKVKAEEAAKPGGSSSKNLDELLKDVLLLDN